MDCRDDEPKKKTNLCQLKPVMLKKKLKKLLNTTGNLCKKQNQSQAALDSFIILSSTVVELLNDPAINDWTPQMHNDVKATCERLVKLCVFKIDEDSIDVLNTLATVFNPNNEFHKCNATRMSESVPPGSDIPDEKLYARPPADPQNPRGWLVDLINRFGDFGGFIILLAKFQCGRPSLTIFAIHWLLRPFGLCHELLTVDTIVKYLMPIVQRVHVILDTLTDEEFKEVAECYRSINRDLCDMIATMESLVSRVPEQTLQNLKSLKLRLIFRLVHTVRGVHELWANFNSNLNLEPWEDVLKHFQTNWQTSNEQTRLKLLALLETWAKDNDLAVSHRVLMLLWDLAHSDEGSTKIIESALGIHRQILFYLNLRDSGDEQLFVWLEKCVEELMSIDKWAFPALDCIKGISEVCLVNTEILSNTEQAVIPRLKDHSLITLIINNLSGYMDKMHQLLKDNPEMDETTFMLDGRYIHRIQVKIRLNTLVVLLRCGQLRFGMNQINRIWQHLVEQPVFNSDREFFFEWFSILDLDPTIIEDFFKQNFLQRDPSLFTTDEIVCFDNFFQHVNKDKSTVDNFIGIDFLWQVVATSPENVANQVFMLLKRAYTIVGVDPKLSVSEYHRTFIAECRNRHQVHSDVLLRLTEVETVEGNDQQKKEIVKEMQKMDRIMKFLSQYIKDCGWEGC